MRPCRLGLASLVFVASCATPAERPRGYAITVAPLALPGVSDACYGLTV